MFSDWLSVSLVFLVTGVVLMLLQKRVLREFTVSELLVVSFAGLAIAGFCYCLVTDVSLAISTHGALLILGIGICAFFGNLGEGTAVKNSPNPGYAGAAVVLSAGLVTMISPFLFQGADLTLVKMVGIAIIFLGATMLCFVPAPRGSSPTTEGAMPHRSWFPPLVLATVSMTAMALLMKGATNELPVAATVTYLSVVLFLSAGISASLSRRAQTNSGLEPRSTVGMVGLLAIIVTLIVGVSAQLYAIQLSPNPGYPIAISSAKGAIVAGIAPLFFRDAKWSLPGWGGMVTSAGGVVLISI